MARRWCNFRMTGDNLRKWLDEAFDEGKAWLHLKNIYDRAGAQGIFGWMDGKEAEDGDGGTKAL